MSISFDLHADFSAPVAAIRKQVISLLGDSVVLEDGFVRVPETLLVTVGEADFEDTDLAMDLFDFRENVTVYFTLYKRNLDAGNVQMWNIVLPLLDTHEGDAVLLYNGDIVVLLRRDGQVTLNQDWEWDYEPNWLISRLSADAKIESIPVA